jgi:hypothetical protein
LIAAPTLVVPFSAVYFVSVFPCLALWEVTAWRDARLTRKGSKYGANPTSLKSRHDWQALAAEFGLSKCIWPDSLSGFPRSPGISPPRGSQSMLFVSSFRIILLPKATAQTEKLHNIANLKHH